MFIVPSGARRVVAKFVKLLKLLSYKQYRRFLFGWGVAAAVEHSAIVRVVRPMTLIDVGANIGQFSLVAHAEAPGLQIFAFEPHAQSAGVYRGAFSTFPRVHLLETAVGACAGTATLHVSGKSDSSSLLEISDEQVAYAPGTQRVADQAVCVTSIDLALKDFAIQSPCLLKIDVQGGELDVLRGSIQMFRKIDFIYCELSFREFYIGQPFASEVIDFLRKFGFTISAVHNLAYGVDGVAVQADFLFKRGEVTSVS